MKRVLQVVTSLELGGTEAYIFNHYRQMKNVVCDFLVFAEKEYPYDEEIRQRGGRIFFCGLPTLKNLRVFIRNIRRCIKNNGPYAAIHAHTNINNAWIVYAAKKEGVPVRISHCHSVNPIKKDPYELFRKRLLSSCATHLFACSEAAGEYLYTGKDYVVMNNSIDVDKYLHSSLDIYLKGEYNLNGKFILGNLSRFDDNKNQTFMLEVLAELLKQRENAVLVLGGFDGGMLQTVKGRAETLGISESVRFVGPRSDVAQWLSVFDAYIMTSKYEGLPIALLEAQAAGLPCYVSDKVTGEADMGLGLVRHFSLTDPEEWARGICEGMERPDDEAIKKAFSARGFDITETAARLESVYINS